MIGHGTKQQPNPCPSAVLQSHERDARDEQCRQDSGPKAGRRALKVVMLQGRGLSEFTVYGKLCEASRKIQELVYVRFADCSSQVGLHAFDEAL